MLSPPSPAVPAACAPQQLHARELARWLGEPLISGNRVHLLRDPGQTLDAMFRAVGDARDHINLESCSVASEGPGTELARRLAERCRDGVKLNLLCHGCGSQRTLPALFAGLPRASVGPADHAVQRWRERFDAALRGRDPRVLLVVDGRAGFVGGTDLGAAHGSTGQTPGRRDWQVSVEGPAVQRLQRLFISHWQRRANAPMQQARYFPPLAPAGTQRVGVASRDAGRRCRPHDGALLGAIDQSRSRVLLTTSSPRPPRRLLTALTNASRRGVAVDLLLPGVTEGWASLRADRWPLVSLLASGARIHEYHDRSLHARACVIDGVWSSVGSGNTPAWPLVRDLESDLIVLDEGFAQCLERMFRDDLTGARRVDAEQWSRRSPLRRAREALARRFESFL